MATTPDATIEVSTDNRSTSIETNLICVLAPVATNDDCKPRYYASSKDVYAYHGYSDGLEYVAMHTSETKKPVLFCGCPIAVAGTVGRQNASGNTGTSVITVAAGSGGGLSKHDGILKVVSGGTIGTSYITLSLSMDGGKSYKAVRLGTASSYTIPYFNVTLSFAAGTLVDGDTALSWVGTAPLLDSTGVQTARGYVAAQVDYLPRTWLVVGEAPDDTYISGLVTEVNAYASENERFSYARTAVRDRLPHGALAQTRVRMTGSPTLTFADAGGTGDTITRSAGSFISDGFAVGDTITVAGSVSNNVTGVVAGVSALVLTMGTTALSAEGPVAGCSVVATPTLTFAEVGGTGDTIVRNRGSWIDDGISSGDTITITGTASNNVSGAVVTATALTLTMGSTDLTPEVIASYGVSLATGETITEWKAAIATEYESIEGEARIDVSAGCLYKDNPFSKWFIRRPVAWFASIREYQKELHVPTWRKADGVLSGCSMVDSDGDRTEYDDRVDGGLSELGFTTARTFANGPAGVYISLSLTKADDDSLLSRTHNMAVVNLACAICHAETEYAIGQVLQLKTNGTATASSLNRIKDRVDQALRRGLLSATNEGPMCSDVSWDPATTDVLNVPGSVLHGTLHLSLNGTIEHIATIVEVS